LFAYGPADPRTPSSLASFKSRLVLPFWYQVSPLVLKKRPSNGHSSSSFHILTSQNSIFIWLWGCFKVLYCRQTSQLYADSIDADSLWFCDVRDLFVNLA